MRIFHLHDWDVNIQLAGEIQRELSRKIIIEGGPEKIKLVAGADVSYSRSDLKAWGVREIPLLLKTFEKALQVIIKSCRGYRIPEPLRQAHILANRVRRRVSISDSEI